MTSALDNAIATATNVVTLLEGGAELRPSVKATIPNLISHLRTLDPSGEKTAALIARLETFA